jgi:hypothetical protein
VAAVENGETRILLQVDAVELPLLNRLLDPRPMETTAGKSTESSKDAD